MPSCLLLSIGISIGAALVGIAWFADDQVGPIAIGGHGTSSAASTGIARFADGPVGPIATGGHDASAAASTSYGASAEENTTVCYYSNNTRTASLFGSGRLAHFGSGRYTYVDAGWRRRCGKASLFIGGPGTAGTDVTLVTGDEFCKFGGGSDFAQYWTDLSGTWNRTVASRGSRGPAYFPLGPSFEFARVSESEILPPNRRDFLLNLIGALQTSPVRSKLAKYVRALNIVGRGPLPNRSFVHTMTKWARHPDIKRNGYLGSDDYRAILLRSVLTLAPAGHNPETFRLWEALEAGSVPVVALDDAYLRHPCKSALRPVIEAGAPIIILNAWSELGGILEDIQVHPERIGAMQRRANAWYRGFMRDFAARFEAALASRIAEKRHGASHGALEPLRSPSGRGGM